MAIVLLQDPEAELGVEGGGLVVRRLGQMVRRIPLHEVEEVQILGRAELSAAARNLLLLRGVDTTFLTMDGLVRGVLAATEGARGERRMAQYTAVGDPARRLRVAKEVVAGKVANQRALLLSRQRMLREEGIADVLAALRGVGPRLTAARDLDAVRGVEGDAAARYFSVFGALLRNAAFTWSGRTRRPPRDPVNACLSYGYTLLFVRAIHAIRAAGLDPYVGVLHEAGRGKEALALDLAEEFRPLVDGVVLTLLNRGQLGPEDFGPPDADLLADEPELSHEGAVYLTRLGRTVLLRAWAQRLAERAPAPDAEGDWTIGGLLPRQAHALRRALLDDEPYRSVEL